MNNTSHPRLLSLLHPLTLPPVKLNLYSRVLRDRFDPSGNTIQTITHNYLDSVNDPILFLIPTDSKTSGPIFSPTTTTVLVTIPQCSLSLFDETIREIHIWVSHKNRIYYPE